MQLEVSTKKEESHFNYKCPGCGGEFNHPVVSYLTSAVEHPKCPFCGRELAGI